MLMISGSAGVARALDGCLHPTLRRLFTHHWPWGDVVVVHPHDTLTALSATYSQASYTGSIISVRRHADAWLEASLAPNLTLFAQDLITTHPDILFPLLARV